MIKAVVGDMFKSKAQTLVNTVNCVGIMGKGIALEFKNRFPDMYEDYKKRCDAGEVRLGQPYVYRRLTPPWILNFPTKDHWRSVSRIEDIIRGLDYLYQHYQEWGITSLAVPPLGCGQGQLEWRVVGPTLYRYLKRLDIPVELYAPYGTPSEQLELNFLEKSPSESTKATSETPRRIEPAWVAVVEILARMETEPYHWPVGRTTLQKIVYFATESGIPTRLQFMRGSFGPYSSELKNQLTRLVNNGLIREERLGEKMFSVKVGPTFPDARKAYAREVEHWSGTVERLSDLFMRLRTNQAEVAATVHFAAKSLAEGTQETPTECEVLAEVMKWKQRRRPPLNEVEVSLAIRNLNMLGWLHAKPSKDLPLNEEALLDV
jgi:O-acetyl-ADP-ribose deacetylase (regulator of RNase III)